MSGNDYAYYKLLYVILSLFVVFLDTDLQPDESCNELSSIIDI